MGGRGGSTATERNSIPALRARHHARRRQALVDLAVELVITEGHQSLSAERLAAEFQCSVGTLYRIVSSLNALRDDVLAELLERQANGRIEDTSITNKETPVDHHT